MTTKQIFRNIPVGTRCTGTVHYFKLNGARLVANGTLSVIDYQAEPGARVTSEYVYNGHFD